MRQFMELLNGNQNAVNSSAFVCTRDAGIVVGVNMGQWMPRDVVV